jgi:S-DNA-T family DNA segregation ATPase FtsK/SpoIIIE
VRKKIEFMADRIEALLSLHKVPARVAGGTLTPRWIRFQVLPQPGYKISRIKGLTEELAAALDVPNVRVARMGAAITIEVPRDDQQPVRFVPLMAYLAEEGGFVHSNALIGLCEDGAPLLVRIASPDVAHILIAGNTGSGKTMLMTSMIMSLAMTHRPPTPSELLQSRYAKQAKPESGGQQTLGLILVDPKGHAFAPFVDLPHLIRPIIHDHAETTECLASLVRLMEKRSASPNFTDPTIILFIDELADYLMVEGKQANFLLTRLTQRGREAGIHIVAATQKPTAAVLGPLVKANFPVRLVGRVASIEDARTGTGWAGTGAERLQGSGDFLAIGEGRSLHFQSPHVSVEELERIVTWICKTGGWTKQPPEHQQGKDTLGSKVMSSLDKIVALFVQPAPAPQEPPPQVKAQATPAPPSSALLTRPQEDILPPAPPPAPDDVEVLVQRLQALDWDPNRSIREACRALGKSEGGAPYRLVSQAVERLRAAALTSQDDSQDAQQQEEQATSAIEWQVYECRLPVSDISLAQVLMGDDQPGDDQQGRGEQVQEGMLPPIELPATATATANATTEKDPDATPAPDLPPSFDSRSRTVAGEAIDPARIPPSIWLDRECLHRLDPLARLWLQILQRQADATIQLAQISADLLRLTTAGKMHGDGDHLEFLSNALQALRLNMEARDRDRTIDAFADVLDAVLIGIGGKSE